MRLSYNRPTAILATLAAALAGLTGIGRAQDAGPVGVVANVKVVSDKVKDVSSLEAWKKSYIQHGMTDKDKALAVWESVVSHQYQDAPPKEFLHNENDVYDALKMFNVYGHSYCGVAACEVASLARYVGLKARVSTIVAHVVPEVEWDGQWHLLDASLINFFVMKDKPADAVNGKFSRALTNYAVPNGNIASIEEIIAAVKEWYAKNPDYLVMPKDPQGKPKGDDAKLRKFHAADGWLSWKKGPALLSDCPLFGWDGWLPAHTHGWYSTMIFNHRIDADYKLPHAGFRPVKIAYLWEEGGIGALEGDSPIFAAQKSGQSPGCPWTSVPACPTGTDTDRSWCSRRWPGRR